MDSITEIAESINFDFTGESRAETFVIEADKQMLLFANVEESTNILLIGDFS